MIKLINSFLNNIIQSVTRMSLTTIINFWFPTDEFQEFWFDGSKDDEIYEQFNELLKFYEKDNYANVNISFLSNEEIFALIILFDQITRNIARLEKSDHRRNDLKCLELINLIFFDELTFPLNKRIFLLLPFRHSRTTKNLDFVIERLNSYTHSEQATKLYQKFYLATLKDYEKVTDTIQVITDFIEIHPPYDSMIHDTICDNFFVGDIEKIKEPNKKIKALKLYKSVEKFVKDNNIKKIGLSLSGGVDSNVLLYILYQMLLDKKIELVIAVHVDYGNRTISTIEANYLINVCKFLNIPIITRKIEHMKRSNDLNFVDRQFYEEETKKIRFGLYKHAINLYNIQGMCLGHHKDDMTENVFMNFSRNKDLLDLFVMSGISENNDVHIYRPMLTHVKEDIYYVAHTFNIMYFKDTTSDECFRGQIRRRIFPEIQKFDINMINNFYEQGMKSTEWGHVIKKLVIEPIVGSEIVGKTGFKIMFGTDFSDLPYPMWSKILSTLFHKKQIRMTSNKNLKTFVDWTNSKTRSTTIFQLTNGIVTCCDHYQLYFFYKSMFLHKDLHTLFSLSEEQKQISIDVWKFDICSTDDCLQTSMSYDDLLVGKFTYTIPFNEQNTFEIKCKLDSHDKTRKLFKDINIFKQFVPKCTAYTEKKFLYDRFAKISMKIC